MTLVVDATLVVAALVDGGPTGSWANQHLGSNSLAAPCLMPVEVANILRRAAMRGEISRDVASMAHGDLLDLRVTLFPYAPFGERVWELTPNLTTYDAWYVALAEELSAPLGTIDRRLTQAPGPRCAFELPPDQRSG